MAEKNYGLLVSALVAIVAIVGLVVLLKGGASGAATVIQGGGWTSFDRPLGNRGVGLLGDNLPCYYDSDGNMVCPQTESAVRTFGPPPSYREGDRPTTVDYASGRGYYT
ncbi:MAG: hypothetical protein ACE5FT_01685 [Candidatus Nanoarchaeia archaeon]